MVRLLSSSVFNRNENCSEVRSEDRQEDPGACLCFFLEIESIDPLDLALLRYHEQHTVAEHDTTDQAKEEDLFVRSQGDFRVEYPLRPSQCILSSNGRGSTQMLDQLCSCQP